MPEQEEKSPILKSWRNVYALVIGTLGAVMAALYFFMRYYS